MKKKFDCVKMKNDIQRELLKEIGHLSLEERKKRFELLAKTDPFIANFLKKTKESEKLELVN